MSTEGFLELYFIVSVLHKLALGGCLAHTVRVLIVDSPAKGTGNFHQLRSFFFLFLENSHRGTEGPVVQESEFSISIRLDVKHLQPSTF